MQCICTSTDGAWADVRLSNDLVVLPREVLVRRGNSTIVACRCSPIWRENYLNVLTSWKKTSFPKPHPHIEALNLVKILLRLSVLILIGSGDSFVWLHIKISGTILASVICSQLEVGDLLREKRLPKFGIENEVDTGDVSRAAVPVPDSNPCNYPACITDLLVAIVALLTGARKTSYL